MRPAAAKSAHPIAPVLKAPDGRPFIVEQTDSITGVWFAVAPGPDGVAGESYLQIAAEANRPAVYVGYRDKDATPVDRLAIGVDSAGAVSVQIVLPGPAEDMSLVKTLSLKQLQALVAASNF